MRDFANFIGELGGETWNTQAVAIALGALAALVAAIVAFTQAYSTRRQERMLKAREHWWARFKSLVDDMTSTESLKKEMGLALLENLAAMKWAAEEDRRMVVKAAVTALAEATRSARKEASER